MVPTDAQESGPDSSRGTSAQGKGADRRDAVRVAIVGTGVSGLNAAFALVQAARPGATLACDLYDPRNRVGGALGSVTADGFLLECAAQGVLTQRVAFTQAVTRIQASLGQPLPLIVPPRKNLARYLMTPRRLVALGPRILTFLAAGLLSVWGVLRALCEWAIPRQSPPSPDETLYAFVARRFGDQVARSFVVPMATGIWAGGARRLLVRFTFPRLHGLEQQFGSLMKAGLVFLRQRGRAPHEPPTSSSLPKGLASFAPGMNHFAESLFRAIEAQCQAKGLTLHLRLGQTVQVVTSLPSAEGGGFDVDGVRYDAVVCAAPPWQGQLRIVAEAQNTVDTSLLILRSLPTHSVAVVGIGGHGARPSAHGFGALAGEFSRDCLGILFVHDLYPQHVPEGGFLYRVLLGGDRAPHILKDSDAQLTARARQWLDRYGLTTPGATVTFEHVVRWPDAIPLAVKGHDNVFKARDHLESSCPGFVLAGNYFEGVGVADALQSGERAARRLMARFPDVFVRDGTA